MATVKQIIGRVKGDKGDTGPTNEIIATVYSYRVTQSPEVPTDGWLSSLPDFQQGDYIWTRTQCTWTAGPDTTMICVGYIGKDGDIASIDVFDEYGRRITALEDQIIPISKGGLGTTTLEGAQARLGITDLQKSVNERFAKINDYTTGANMIRGTRDLRAGVERYTNPGVQSVRYIDGLLVSSSFTKTFGDDGFALVTTPPLVTTSVYQNLSVISSSFKIGDYVTIAFEFRVNGNVADVVDRLCIIADMTKDGTGTNLAVPTISEMTFHDSLEPNKWIRASYIYKFTKNIDFSNTAVLLSLAARGSKETSTTVSFRKPGFYMGAIENPIWSPSPFDIDYINDITTGENLLRGTRDFVPGRKDNIGPVYSDGFQNFTPTLWKLETCDDGFNCISVDRNTTDSANSYIRTSYFEQKGRTLFTISGEVRLKRLSATNLMFCRMVGLNEVGTEVGNVSGRFNEIGIDTSLLNEWQNFKYVFNVSNINNVKILFCDFMFSNNSTSAYSFRKIALYEGIIDNPRWNASPFDVAQQADFEKLDGVLVPLYLGGYAIETDHSGIIVSGKNVDDVLTPGTYQVSGAATNNPAKTTAMMIVSRTIGETANTGYTRQVFTAFDEGARTYIRYKPIGADSAWTNWREMVNNKSLIPIEMGGTNANTLAGAKTNLGITSLESRVQTLEQQIASLIAPQ